MKTWSLKECDSVALGQRYSEVEADCNLQSRKPHRVCVCVLCQDSARLPAALQRGPDPLSLSLA